MTQPHHSIARSNFPIILDKKVLDDGLHTLFTSFASDLSVEFSIPMLSATEIQSLCTCLATYLTQFVGHSLRHSNELLRPENLEFHILRSRNASEECQDEEGKWLKGEKKRYRLVLYETTFTAMKEKGNNDKKQVGVQILAEGEMRLEKAEVLEGFQEAVKKKLERWEQEEKNRNTRLKEERLARRRERKKAAGNERQQGKKTKAKKKASVKKKIKIEDESEDENLDLELGANDEEPKDDASHDG